jgi:hypothetical protein
MAHSFDVFDAADTRDFRSAAITLARTPQQEVVNLSRAFCDPRPQALINTMMEIGANYKMASTIKKK